MPDPNPPPPVCDDCAALYVIPRTEPPAVAHCFLCGLRDVTRPANLALIASLCAPALKAEPFRTWNQLTGDN